MKTLLAVLLLLIFRPHGPLAERERLSTKYLQSKKAQCKLDLDQNFENNYKSQTLLGVRSCSQVAELKSPVTRRVRLKNESPGHSGGAVPALSRDEHFEVERNDVNGLYRQTRSIQDIPVYTRAELLGDFNPADMKGFVEIRSRYTSKSDAYLREEVYEAFKEMWKDARRDDIDLTIISATRNREYQKGIWNRKWNSYTGSGLERAKQILQYSSMPGISRHHWGTDFDLNSLENAYFESEEGKKVYQWLKQNAGKYGFFQPYTQFNAYRDAGYREEKWHWSYYPTASQLQRAYSHIITYDDITGFTGSEYARELDVINNYVNGIGEVMLN